MDYFALGFVIGVTAGIPLFYSAETAIAVLLQIGIVFATSVLTGSSDALISLFHKTGDQVVSNPNFAVGFIVGLIFSATAFSIMRRNRLDGD